MWGGAGEDAMVGDRGGVQTRFVEVDGSDAGDPDIVTHTSQGPPGINLGGPDSGAAGRGAASRSRRTRSTAAHRSVTTVTARCSRSTATTSAAPTRCAADPGTTRCMAARVPTS